jgi:hypothetical protein
MRSKQEIRGIVEGYAKSGRRALVQMVKELADRIETRRRQTL